MKPEPVFANPIPQLTDRQKEVLKLMSQDLSSKEIAHRLGISTKTVQFHRDTIKRRLGVHGSAGLIRYAIRAEIIKP